MNTLAAFKERMKQTEIILAVNHIRPQYNGQRRILKCQSTGFWWAMAGVCDRAWTEFPPRSQLSFEGPDTVHFHKDGLRLLTITFIEGGA